MELGLRDYRVLANTHSREALLNYMTQNGIQWEESNNEPVNWLRASMSLARHLDGKGEFITDNLTPELIQDLTQRYTELLEVHKKSMLPHIRSAMQKLREEGDGTEQDMDLLQEAHVHLAKYGGATWADKIHTLRVLNTNLDYLEKRASDVPIEDTSE